MAILTVKNKDGSSKRIVYRSIFDNPMWGQHVDSVRNKVEKKEASIKQAIDKKKKMRAKMLAKSLKVPYGITA